MEIGHKAERRDYSSEAAAGFQKRNASVWERPGSEGAEADREAAEVLQDKTW